MYCYKCGTVNPDDAKFCKECGAMLASPPVAVPPQPSPRPEVAGPQPTSSEDKWLKRVMITLGLIRIGCFLWPIISLMVLLGAIWLWSSGIGREGIKLVKIVTGQTEEVKKMEIEEEYPGYGYNYTSNRESFRKILSGELRVPVGNMMGVLRDSGSEKDMTSRRVRTKAWVDELEGKTEKEVETLLQETGHSEADIDWFMRFWQAAKEDVEAGVGKEERGRVDQLLKDYFAPPTPTP